MLTTISQSTTIDAPITLVMKSFYDIQNWPSWSKSCRRAIFLTKSEWDGNSKFLMSISLGPLPITLTNTFTVTNPLDLPQDAIEWNATKFGIESKHLWQFKEIQPNVTRINSIETITGTSLFLFVPLGISLVIKYLNYRWIRDFKKNAEDSFKRTNNSKSI